MTVAAHTLKILIAEDNEADVFLIKHALQEHGLQLEADVAANGEQAFAFLRRFNAAAGVMLDLVLLDLNLGTHHGTEILAEIRSRPELQQVPVVILTSSDSPRDREQTMKLGANLFIRKPMDLTAFLKIGAQIATVLRER